MSCRLEGDAGGQSRYLLGEEMERALSDFFAMGGYGAYVWPAFGFAALVLLGLLLQSWWAARRREAELEQLRRQLRPGRPPRPQLRPVAQKEAGRAPVEVSRDASA
jgi:heme exporter protein D